MFNIDALSKPRKSRQKFCENQSNVKNEAINELGLLNIVKIMS